MRLESITALAELSGMNRATVSKRLGASGIEPRQGSKGARTYPAPQALRVLLLGEAGELDPRVERALLDRSRREHQEMQNAKTRGDMVPAAEVEAEWRSLLGAVRSGMLAVPTRVSPELVALTDERAIEDAVQAAIHEAMQAVADGAAQPD